MGMGRDQPRLNPVPKTDPRAPVAERFALCGIAHREHLGVDELDILDAEEAKRR